MSSAQIKINCRSLGDLNTIQNHKYLQSLQRDIVELKNDEEAKQMLNQIASLINREAISFENDAEWPANQVLLNLAFRNYYMILERFQPLPDIHFGDLIQKLQHEKDFQMLYAILLTPHYKKFDGTELQIKCQEAISLAINENSASSLSIIKVFNLLCRKFPTLDVDVPLHQIYFLLQSDIFGLREETLSLFCHCVKNLERAKKYFEVINGFWPWTNRNKYYLLSCILNTHALPLLLIEYDDFFKGLRLALSYKRLFASSQYLVKSLSAKESKELLDLSLHILLYGSKKEISNFHSQWFGRISQKSALFLLLQQQLEISSAPENSKFLEDPKQRYRLILIFSMFSREIFQLSKLHFFKISTELITNCFNLETDSQLLIFKFVVDNFTNFAIEDCLEFLLSFIKTHKTVEHAQYRNNILGKMPTVINYISKTYNRLAIDDSSTLKSSIKYFFMELQKIIEIDIGSTVYQPKIFALKLMEILLKSLYSQSPVKNAKNCIIAQNQKLGRFLIESKVFDAEILQIRIFALLRDPQGFDDALELQVVLLKQLNYTQNLEAFNLCKNIVKQCEIDDCALSAIYAKVAVNSNTACANSSGTLLLFNYCFDALNAQLADFENDPLLTCKTKNHLFGFLETINVCASAYAEALQEQFKSVLILLHNILNIILKMLNLSTLKTTENMLITAAASFQDMDESLEILVRNSEFNTESNDSCRKFLLMSFWLTLKACCDLATTIACQLVLTSGHIVEHHDILEKCLHINVSVLTKCRHKGAIEAAGVSIGLLTKSITSQLTPASKAYKLLQCCLDLLFENCQQISTTRRGAGLSIMLLHIVKNEEQRKRPLLKRAMSNIVSRLQTTCYGKHEVQEAVEINSLTSQNYDCLESLTLHYLCVLVKDTELREHMTKFYDDIMMAAMKQIDNPEWIICNAALQLFGALVPKIVGQKQASEFEIPVEWDPTEVSFMEITLKLPKTSSYILNYCLTKKKTSGTSIRSIILFLEFLSKVEHLRKCDTKESKQLLSFRELMWSLLSHQVEKVRKLAAICFVRLHEFRCDLPQALLNISKLLFKVRNENFFQGITYVMIDGALKLKHDSLYSINSNALSDLFTELQLNLEQNFEIRYQNLYSRCKVLDLLLILGFDKRSDFIRKLIEGKNNNKNCIGCDIWHEKITQLF